MIITGTSREDLNGKTGVASSFDHAQGRYVVVCMDKKGGKKVALRSKYLREAQ